MATAQARGLAAQCWCDPSTSNRVMDEGLAEIFAEQIDKYIEALIWCSGSADFAPEGQARTGWDKLCRPLIEEFMALDEIKGDAELQS